LIVKILPLPLSSNNKEKQVKRYKTKEVIKMLEADGWYLKYTNGDHRQFKHPIKKGKVTVNGKPNEVLDQFLLNNIWKQAGWK
jgi:predicted RNA binding protein YcfA (HicA-like mRNA interferase family)